MKITKKRFNELTPRQRGYVVYMCGSRKDQPNVPNEKNPYPKDSEDYKEWNTGQRLAVLEVQDIDD